MRLAHAWHERVLADEVVSHAFSHGFHPQHTERLAAYWAEALGGPTTFSERYGDETRSSACTAATDPTRRWTGGRSTCFDQALRRRRARPTSASGVLHDYFAWATTTTMARYHDSADDVPDGLTIPHWSWDGLVPA